MSGGFVIDDDNDNSLSQNTEEKTDDKSIESIDSEDIDSEDNSEDIDSEDSEDIDSEDIDSEDIDSEDSEDIDSEDIDDSEDSEDNPLEKITISQDPVDVALRVRILELYLPPHNKKIKDIAILINRSRSYVYYKLQELVELGHLKKNEKTGHIIREMPESQIDGYADVMKSDFNKYKSIERWIAKMKRDKIKNWAYQVTDLYKICKTLERTPDHFLAPLEMVEQMTEEFEEKFKAGEAYYIDSKNKSINTKNREDVSIGHFVKAIRSFRQRLGHPVPKGVGGILSVTEDTGNYAKLKMTDWQIKKGIEYMFKISQVMGMLFVIHHETGVRTDTLFNMKLSFRQKIIEVLKPQTQQRIPCELFILDVHEKKTADDYSKIIISPPARKVIRKLKQGQTLVEKGDWKSKKEYNKHLKNFYKNIGLLVGEEFPKKGTQEYYLQNMPSHFVRHSWSHWLMRCTGFNATVVSKFAWEDTKTLTKIYSKQSIDEILSIGDCQFCRPSLYRKPDDDLYFCCLQHAIAYYNEQEPPELPDGQSGQIPPDTPKPDDDSSKALVVVDKNKNELLVLGNELS